MATDFKVPDLGENVEEGDIVKVMVNEGDEIAADQNVMEIETGKAVVELPCPIAGKVTKVHVQKGPRSRSAIRFSLWRAPAAKPPKKRPRRKKRPLPRLRKKKPRTLRTSRQKKPPRKLPPRSSNRKSRPRNPLPRLHRRKSLLIAHRRLPPVRPLPQVPPRGDSPASSVSI